MVLILRSDKIYHASPTIFRMTNLVTVKLRQTVDLGDRIRFVHPRFRSVF